MLNLKEKFIPYEIALSLKTLGYNEPSFTYMDNMGNIMALDSRSMGITNSELSENFCSAILYQEAEDWFIKKYRILITILWYPQLKKWGGEIYYMNEIKWITNKKIIKDTKRELMNECFNFILKTIVDK